MTITTNDSPSSEGPWSRLLWLALALLAAWLFWPVLFPVHVEGFSASIVALGLLVAEGSVRDFMPFAPLNADYYGLTKLGAVLGVAWLSPLLGGEGAFRLLLWGGMALTLGASAWLIRQWSGSRWIVCAATLVLMPGIAESGFFFNDNVLAAGLILPALAIILRWRSPVAALIAGALIGCAVTVRTDMMVLAATAVPLIAIEQQSWRKAAIFTGIAGATAIAVLFALYALVGATPIDAARVGALAVTLWARTPDPWRFLSVILLFCGLPGLLLAALGAARLARVRAWHRVALLAGVPVLFNLILFGKMWEVRQMLVLAPFVGALVARGIDAAITEAGARRWGLPATLSLVALFTLAGPILGYNFSDGPRELTGRLAGIVRWRGWQETVRQDFARIDRLVAATPDGRPLAIITDGWNDDRYLHLVLLERGFRRAPVPPACTMIGEAMRSGSRTVVQLSMRQSFLKHWEVLQPMRFERRVLPCLAAIRAERVALLATGPRGAALLSTSPVKIPDDLADDPLVATPVDGAALARLGVGYRRGAIGAKGSPDIERAEQAVVSQSGFSR